MNEVSPRVRGAVHAAVRHDSAIAHVTGSARYLDDVATVPGTLEAALVLSPHAHARIRSVDLSACLAASGLSRTWRSWNARRPSAESSDSPR